VKITIERVANGYTIKDEPDGETFVVANNDHVLAAWEMLTEVNDRIGSSGDSDGERSMSIALLPSRRWLEFHRDECRHAKGVERWDDGGEMGWQCPCGQKFAPVASDD
jgi:hypothetical protein